MELVAKEVVYDYVYPGHIRLGISNQVFMFVANELRWEVKERVWERMFFAMI